MMGDDDIIVCCAGPADHSQAMMTEWGIMKSEQTLIEIGVSAGCGRGHYDLIGLCCLTPGPATGSAD